MSVPAVGAAISRPQTRHHPGSCHCEAAEGDCGNPFSHHPQDNYISTTRRVTEAGTFASAAGGGKSEQKGVAAVEILRAISEQEISGTATGHNGAAPLKKNNFISSLSPARELTYTEGYRSGHNGAVLKTVRAQVHAGSNPAPSAKKKTTCENMSFFSWPARFHYLALP